MVLLGIITALPSDTGLKSPSRFEEYGIDPRRPLLPPQRGFVSVEEIYAALGGYSVLELKPDEHSPAHVKTTLKMPPQLAIDDASW